MPRAFTIQTNFTSGEISPQMFGRVDVSKYFNGVEKLRNFIVRPQGGASKRSGTVYVGTVKDSTKKTIVRKFEFSNVQTYMLEFGHNYIRFYSNGALVETSPGVPLEVATTYDHADLAGLKFSQSADVLFITHGSYSPKKLSRISHLVWSLSDLAFVDGPYLDYNTDKSKKLTITSYSSFVYLKADGTLTFSNADTGKYIEFKDDTTNQWQLGLMFENIITSTTRRINLAGLNVKQTSKEAYITVSAGVASANYSGVFVRADVGKVIRDSSGAPGSGTWYRITGMGTDSSKATVTAITTMLSYSWPSESVSIYGYEKLAVVSANWNAFSSSMVGSWLRMNFSSKFVAGKIKTYSSPTLVEIDCYVGVLDDAAPPYDDNTSHNFSIGNIQLQNNGVTSLWALGAWSTANGWPIASTIHEGRLVFGGTTLQPQTIWGSVPDDFANFSPTDFNGVVSDDNAYSFTFGSQKVNGIIWLSSGPVLLIGTKGGEWQMKASTIDQAITPTNISITVQTEFGSKDDSNGRRIGSSVLFIQKSGRKIREMTYDFQIDQFNSKDISVLSEHILRQFGGAVYSVHQVEPISIYWILCSDGTLVGMTYEKEQEIVAFHVHELGGDGVVESIDLISDDDSINDVLYMVVKRTINGSDVRYVEYLSDLFDGDIMSKDDMLFLDCSKTYTGTATTTITGLDHLEGETVSVCADGAKIENKVVSGGSVTLDIAASRVSVGYSYQAYGKPLKIEGGSQIGSSQGKTKIVNKVTIRFENSIGIRVGKSLQESDLAVYSFRETSDPMNQSPALQTGDKEIDLDQGYGTDGQYFFEHSDPYPCTILALMPQMNTTEQ